MNIKKRVQSLKRQIEKLFRIRIYSSATFGHDKFCDILTFFDLGRASIIFDVGANVGQSIDVFSEKFSNAEIFSFEPVWATFCSLHDEFGNCPTVKIYNLALSDSSGIRKISSWPNSTVNSLVDADISSNDDFSFEEVTTVSIDEFCRDNLVEVIDYLKVDAEGHENHVISGSKKMLKSHSIRLIELELGFNQRENSVHCNFESMTKELRSFGYFLVGIYDQTVEWPTNEKHLRRANAVFASSTCLQMQEFN